MMSAKWDQRFLDLAQLVGSWSRDPSTRVGCCITDPFNRVVSLGFNGFPKGVSDEILDRDQKLRRTIHAEPNALHFAHRDVTGCTAYVTHPPCSNCAASLIQRGIGRVVYPAPDEGFRERWQVSYAESLAMFSEAGVIVDEVPCL
jgi:dCMP deaminase